MGACFSLPYIEQLLIWLVVIIGLIAILQLVFPWLMAQIGASPDGGLIGRIIKIVTWVVVTIFCIYIVFDLLSCVFGTPGLHSGVGYVR